MRNPFDYFDAGAASPAQRAILENTTPPVTNPIAQDYAVWRRTMLRRVIVGVILQTVLLGANFIAHIDEPTPRERLEQHLPEEMRSKIKPAPPDDPEAEFTPGALALIVLVSAIALASMWFAFLAFDLIVVAALSWRWVRWSRRLARWAWALWFFSPLPLALIPHTWLPQAHGIDAWTNRAEQIQATLSFFLPSLFALLPAVLRTALRLKQVLPESQLPGRLATLSAPFCSVGYVLILSILLQFVVDGYLVMGFVFLAISPAPYWIWGSALLRTETPENARRTARWIFWTCTALVGAGLFCLGRFFWDVPYIDLVLERLNFIWFLAFLVGGFANRALLTVVLCDYLLAAVHQQYESAKQWAGTPSGAALDEKMDALGKALG